MWQPCLTQTSYQSPRVGFKLNPPKPFPLIISQFPPYGSCHWAYGKVTFLAESCKASWHCYKFGLSVLGSIFFCASSIPSLPNFPFAHSLFPLGLLFSLILLFLKGLLWKASDLAKGPYAQAGSQGFHLKLFPYVYLAFPSILHLSAAYEPDMQANQLITNKRQRKSAI